MPKKHSSPPATPQEERADWSTPAARVRWLVEARFQGNKSAFASAIGFSHTAINKVVSGERAPGLKLLTAIRQALPISSAWLLDGQGQPFREPPDLAGRGIPVTDVLLPGPPLDHQDQVTGGWVEVPDQLFTPTQYWLLLTTRQPLLRQQDHGFRVGDQLLMETDRAKFPRPDKLVGRLCVVRVPDGPGKLKLASVTHYDADPETGPEHLEADFFDEGIPPEKIIREEVYRHHPGGEITHHLRRLKLTQVKGKERPVPLDGTEVEPALPRIRYTDIVAVWVQLLYRHNAVI